MTHTYTHQQSKSTVCYIGSSITEKKKKTYDGIGGRDGLIVEGTAKEVPYKHVLTVALRDDISQLGPLGLLFRLTKRCVYIYIYIHIYHKDNWC